MSTLLKQSIPEVDHFSSVMEWVPCHLVEVLKEPVCDSLRLAKIPLGQHCHQASLKRKLSMLLKTSQYMSTIICCLGNSLGGKSKWCPRINLQLWSGSKSLQMKTFWSFWSFWSGERSAIFNHIFFARCLIFLFYTDFLDQIGWHM